MRKILLSVFLTMDGVLQSPGGPEEDNTNNFKYGGWMFYYGDDVTNEAVGKLMERPFDLLLGRRTYEIFSAYWPYKDDQIGQLFNRVNKYVVATTPVDLSWSKSVLIGKDVVNELKVLKESEGPDLLVFGSGNLIQTLLSAGLVDELHTMVFPVTLGEGKKLFDSGTGPQQWKVTQSVVSPNGAVVATYVPDGAVKHGSFLDEKPSEAELARRKKWHQEEQGTD